MMESKTDDITGVTFRGMDREIHNRFHDSSPLDIEASVDATIESALDNVVRSSVDTHLREKYT